MQNDKQAIKQEATKPVAVEKKTELISSKDEQARLKDEGTSYKSSRRRRSSSVPILSFLCLLFLVAFLWLLYQNYRNSKLASIQKN